MPRAGLALEDATSWELLCRLADEGFRWAKLPMKVKDRPALPPYKPGGDMVWYSLGASCRPQYTRALLRADDLFEKGMLQILHWSNDKYYSQLARGEVPRASHENQGEGDAPRSPRRRLELDAEEDLGPIILIAGAGPGTDTPVALEDLALHHNLSLVQVHLQWFVRCTSM